MTKEDKTIAVVCIILLIVSIIFFSIIKTEEKMEADVTTSGGDMLDATRDFLVSGKNTMITAEALYANIDDGYAGNDPYILSVRGTDDYKKGHIPGAENIPWRSVFTKDNISKLPMNKQIVVYCYTGHTASQTTALLNIAGYDAVCLKWGICSWTTNTSINLGKCYTSPGTDYPVVTGSSPGTRCGGDEPAPTTAPADTGGEAVDLTGDIGKYLSSGKPAAMSAGDLNEKLTNADSSDDPFVLSIRSSSQYEKGHI